MEHLQQLVALQGHHPQRFSCIALTLLGLPGLLQSLGLALLENSRVRREGEVQLVLVYIMLPKRTTQKVPTKIDL